MEAQADASTAAVPAGEGADDAAKSRPCTSGKDKKPSMLGVALGAKIGSACNELSPPCSPVAINRELTARISSKYAGHVKASEELRAAQHVPLERLSQVRPDALGMTRAVKRDMDSALQKSPDLHRHSLTGPAAGQEGAASGDADATAAAAGADDAIVPAGDPSLMNPVWETLFSKEDFKKRMQYLHSHSKTGNFIEHYGTQGIYEGEFLYGMRHGKGTHEFRDEVYEGDWKWDQRHGWGTLSLKDGSTVKAEWLNGKPSGYTTMTDAKGTIVYEGEFKDGKRHGLGRQLFESGDMYDGGWAEGKLHDRGVYYFTNGDKLYGMWNKGIYDGVGVFHYADGSISRREYRKGILQSVQDYECASQRFGKTVNRAGMHKHTQDQEFPKEAYDIIRMTLADSSSSRSSSCQFSRFIAERCVVEAWWLPRGEFCSNMPTIKLTYFNIEAAAEKVRLALVMTGTPFEDNRIDFKDWAALKATTPFGQLPVMEVTEDDGTKKVFAQSPAMMRYIARRFDKTGKLYPADADASLQVEEMLGLSDDMARAWSPSLYLGMGRHMNYGHPEEWPAKAATVQALREKFIAEELPKFMGYFTAALEKSGAFLCGASPTIADLQLFPQLRYYTKGVADHVPADCLDKFPAIKAYLTRMLELPEIKAWYKL
eukprot:TRINITY_DN38206_c0_g1_i1.p1 TRINITY_DN38206_c0_g1~~TRINITY_DN38206_c0_g1_i1.p1  ORF type:complete len:656 (+),score=166.83 TRINITY_DN38206_c0_g1_i1:137-2104(+)